MDLLYKNTIHHPPSIDKIITMENIVESIWSKSKLLVKAGMIFLIVLILQIPTFYIRDLISEREARQKEAVTEVSNKWAARQHIAGPVLVLPYWMNAADSGNVQSRHYAYFLPDELTIRSTITPEEKHRGIYKVMLYSSSNKLTGSFNNVSLGKLNIRPESVDWNNAFVHVNIADLKGINDEIKLQWKGQTISMTADAVADAPFEEGVNAKINLAGPQDLAAAGFSVDVQLNGSGQLLFTPVGKSTTVDVQGKWPHPSFTGDILPATTDIRKDSFSARWKSVAQKRNFPQQWKDNAFRFLDINHAPAGKVFNNINDAAFGTDLFVPVNDYQKTMRSIKYAALCILLTFAAFFIIETTRQRSVHPFQYGLIGLALVLFYTLLLSFSEYTGFNIAYIIASVCTIGLITWFVKDILTSSRLSIILSLVLLLVYTYVFTILQLQDYSLLLGSVGLFIALGVIMHFSKKIKW